MSVRKTWPSQLQTRRVMIEKERQISIMQREHRDWETERERESVCSAVIWKCAKFELCVELLIRVFAADNLYFIYVLFICFDCLRFFTPLLRGLINVLTSIWLCIMPFPLAPQCNCSHCAALLGVVWVSSIEYAPSLNNSFDRLLSLRYSRSTLALGCLVIRVIESLGQCLS